MNFTNILLTIFLRILPSLIENMSPALRELIVNYIKELEKHAQKTENIFDDLLVVLLKAIFDVK
ncbi:MAG TPA: hypothetical protein ENG63_10350 [Candidatus Desulfofervidus auxilii]|uniref:Uncharacterized protein n=1 Tax=Desulfofervidus auxilii TaxID=1621989 RepID=A0A7C0U3Z4_DESA2|nr:hypothetical protein [Candidatus Desulfofervidus auxilii]